jgi:NAD(P)-dependent dehydrogenase (short-subunit alcohol dehydrogenase family)
MSESRLVVITGGSSGIGKAAATRLAKDGATVVITGRDPQRTKAVAEQIDGIGHVSNFEKLDDVRDLADRLLAAHPRIDVLINNAGSMYNVAELTADGFERTLQTNYLAPFLLTRLLLPRLTESRGRVVSTSSTANAQGRVLLDDLNFTRRRWNSGLGAYGASKLMINLFTKELARMSTVPAFTVHPGFVRTGLAPDWWVLRMIKAVTLGRYGVVPEEGAKPLIRLAGPDAILEPNGTYFDKLKPNGKEGRQAADPQLAKALWDRTSVLLGLPARL